MTPLIKTENLSVSYGNVEAIENVSLSVSTGEFVCIFGPNGGGKTTLLNTLLGFIAHFSGTCFVSKDAVISYVPQSSAVDRGFPISVLDMVLTAHLKKGLHPFKKYSKAEKQAALSAIELVGLKEAQNRQIGELSGGEFQRLLLARALCSNPTVLLLDEPTANVDPLAKTEIFKLLKSLKDTGITVITVTHDLTSALSSCDRAIYINRHLLYDGAPHKDELAHLLFGGEAL